MVKVVTEDEHSGHPMVSTLEDMEVTKAATMVAITRTGGMASLLLMDLMAVGHMDHLDMIKEVRERE